MPFWLWITIFTDVYLSNDRNGFGSHVESLSSPAQDTTLNTRLLPDGTAKETADQHIISQTAAVRNTPIAATEPADTAVLIQHTEDGVREEVLSDKAVGKRHSMEHRPTDSHAEGNVGPHCNDESGGVNAETAMPHNGAYSDTVEQSQQFSNWLTRF